MNIFNNFCLKIFVLYIACLTGCQISPGPLCIKDGITYGVTQSYFRGRWFNYYERGLSYKEGKCFDAALDDFNKAIFVRNKDNRKKSTYGAMHFIRYFPHRESGVIHYLMSFQNDNPLETLLKARNEIHQSLEQDATNKARFWEVRIEKRIQKLSKISIHKPTVTIHSLNSSPYMPGKPVLVQFNELTVSGEVYDPRFVSAVTLNNKPIDINGAQSLIPFQTTLVFQEGSGIVKICAKNFSDGKADVLIPILVDTSGPEIRIMSIDDGIIRGKITDRVSGVHSVYIQTETEKISIIIDESGFFQTHIDPVKLNDNTFLIATDTAGNVARVMMTSKRIQKESARPLLLASSENVMTSDAHVFPRKAFHPDIYFLGFKSAETVYVDQIYISGQVDSFIPIRFLSIKKDKHVMLQQQISTDDIIMNFEKNIHLTPGNNQILVTVEDEYSRKYSKKLTIIRCIPADEEISNRYAVRTVDFDLSSKIKSQIGIEDYQIEQYSDYLSTKDRIIFQNILFNSIHKQGRFFTQLKQYQQADAIIFGDTTQTNEGIEVNMRLISLKDRQLLGEFDSYTTNCTKEGLTYIGHHLCKQLHNAFQRYQGSIIKIFNNKFIIHKDNTYGQKNAGATIIGWTIIIYEMDNLRFNPVTHVLFGAATHIKGFGTIIGKHNKSYLMMGADFNQPQIGLKVTNK